MACLWFSVRSVLVDWAEKQVYALIGFVCVYSYVFMGYIPDFRRNLAQRVICLDTIEGDASEFIIAKS